jgi:hypothetical protein
MCHLVVVSSVCTSNKKNDNNKEINNSYHCVKHGLLTVTIWPFTLTQPVCLLSACEIDNPMKFCIGDR